MKNITSALCLILIFLASIAVSQEKYGVILSVSWTNLSKHERLEFDEIRVPEEKFFIKVQKGASLQNSVLMSRIVDFNFTGSPAALLTELKNKGLDVELSRSVSAGTGIDRSSKLEIIDFSGTLLDLLKNCVPENYKTHAWSVNINEDGSLLVGFNGGNKKTIQIEEPQKDPLPSLRFKPVANPFKPN